MLLKARSRPIRCVLTREIQKTITADFIFLRRFPLNSAKKAEIVEHVASNGVEVLDWFCYSLAFWLNASHSSWHNPILDVFQLLACVQTDWPNRCPRHNKWTFVCGLVTGEMPGVPEDLSLQTLSFSVFRRHVRTTVITLRVFFFFLLRKTLEKNIYSCPLCYL